MARPVGWKKKVTNYFPPWFLLHAAMVLGCGVDVKPEAAAGIMKKFITGDITTKVFPCRPNPYVTFFPRWIDKLSSDRGKL